MLPYGIIWLFKMVSFDTLRYFGRLFVVIIKAELLKRFIMDFIDNRIDDFEIDADLVANTIAINILAEIQEIIKNENYTDFEKVEEIVCLFEKNEIDSGSCHDF